MSYVGAPPYGGGGVISPTRCAWAVHGDFLPRCSVEAGNFTMGKPDRRDPQQVGGVHDNTRESRTRDRMR